MYETKAMYESRTAAQVFTLALGLALLTIGIAGFVAEAAIAAFASNGFGVRHVTIFFLDPWHSGLHTLAGLLGLATWRRADSARVYAIAIGALYLLVAVWGFTIWSVGPGNEVFGLMHIRLADNIAHAVIGVAGLVVGLASPWHGAYPVPRTAELG